MQYIIDFAAVIVKCLLQLWLIGRAPLWIGAAVGGAVAILFFIGSLYYPVLWNKSYSLRLWQRLMFGFWTLGVFLFCLVFAALVYVAPVAQATIGLWAADIKADKEWRAKTFAQAYQAVKKLGVEDFTSYPPPAAGKESSIPTTKPESIQTVASLYASEATENYDRQHPFLSKVLWAHGDIASDYITKDVTAHFAGGNHTYPTDKAIDLAGKWIGSDLDRQTPHAVWTARGLVALLSFFLTLIPFALVGYLAYRDLGKTK